MNRIEADISIVGAGVTGLILTKKFSDLGYNVALIDKQNTVGAGPSTKNEGWLHRGTYHATSIKDKTQAMEVARRCIYGHEQIRGFAPEAVEGIGIPTFAVVSKDELAHSSVERWNSAGVAYRSVKLSNFEELNPEVDTTKVSHVFEVGDVSLNQRILYQKLLAQGVRNGAQVFLNSQFMPESSHSAKLLRPDGDSIDIHSNMFIVTAGYGMKDIYQQATGEELTMRYWKSHLLVFPRLTSSNTFYIDSGEAALFNHGATSIVGMHEDAQVEYEPNFTVRTPGEKLVYDATKRLIPKVEQYEDAYTAVACIKPDIARSTTQARSLDIDIMQPNPNYLFALPGKMTEAPYVTDKIVQMVFDGDTSKNATVALRPCDIFQSAQV